MTQTSNAKGAKALYRPKFWHSALFGLLAGIFYLAILEGSSIGSPSTDSNIQFYGAGVMTAIGFVAWQWRVFTAIIWACVLVGILATSGGGVFDWLGFVVLSLAMMGPFINFEGLAFVEKLIGPDEDENSPTRTWD